MPKPKVVEIGRCEKCLYWEQVPHVDRSAGYCRRYPEVVYDIDEHDMPASTNPVTLGTQWCGEFKPKHLN